MLPAIAHLALIAGLRCVPAESTRAGPIAPMTLSPAASFRLTFISICVYAMAALAIVPIAAHPGPEIPGITALFVGIVFVTQLGTSFLLFVRFRETATWSLLLLGCAYLFSALMVIPHLLAFPGAVLVGRPLIEASQQAPGWIFVLWINGYSLLALASILLEARFQGARITRRHVDRAILLAVVVVPAVVLCFAVLTTVLVGHLPPLMGGSSWTTLNRLLSGLALLMLGSGVLIILSTLRSPLFLWLSLALTAMACANILSEAGGGRYTFGWSFGRVSWLVSASALFLYFMHQLVQQRVLLREREQQFELLVQGVKDYAIFMLDPRGYVSSWNTGAQQIKGYRAEEIIGRHFSQFYTPEDQQNGLPILTLAQAEKDGKYEAEGWRRRKDGSRFWASVVIDALRNDDGRLIGFAKITRDITEQRNARALLEQARDRTFQSQKMEAVGQLTGGVAHDFNNLLTIIIGNLDTAKRHVGSLTGGIADQLTRVIGNARTGAERAAVLTQRLLAFSRRQPLSPQALDVNKFIAGAVDFLQRSLGETIEIEAVGGGGLWQVEADRHQLETSLLNLAVNARDAMPDGGKLTIETSNAFLDEEYCRSNPEIGPGQYVLISVSDTGGGMPPEVASRAFEPFFTTKNVGEGTGLGLSQVYGFVKQSGGHIKIYTAGRKSDTRDRGEPNGSQKSRRDHPCR
jgi:PAS domain S-box-containing protein